MAAREPVRRRFLTSLDVEQAARSGEPLRLGERDVLTDAAHQRARDLSVEVVRGGAAPAPTPAAPARGPAEEGVDPATLRRLVLAALHAELGPDAAGLDEALDRVLERLPGA